MILAARLMSPKIGRATLGWIVVAALVFHGLIPLGYMPDAARADEPMAMTMCDGMNMSSMAMGDEDRQNDNSSDKNKPGEKPSDHAPCPFSVNAVFAFASAAPNVPTPIYLFIAIVIFSVFSFAAPHRFGNAAPRAPPLGV